MLALCLTLLLSGTPGSRPPESGPAPLLPRSLFFRTTIDRMAVRISPDGTRIAYRASATGPPNIWLAQTDHPESARSITHCTGEEILPVGWAYNGHDFLYLDSHGAGPPMVWHVYAVNADTGTDRDLTPQKGIHAQVLRISPAHPDEVLVAIDDRKPNVPDAYRIRLDTGERTLVERNDRFTGLYADARFRIRAATAAADTGAELFVRGADNAWRAAGRLDPHFEGFTRVVTVSPEGDRVYLLDSSGRDKVAFEALDVATGKRSVLAQDRDADMDKVMLDGAQGRVEAVSAVYGRRRWQPLDRSVAPDLAYLHRLEDGDLEVPSQSLDGRRWIVAYVMGPGPFRYYLYDRPARTARFLFTSMSRLEGVRLGDERAVTIPARDGLRLPCYLVLPPGEDTRHGRPPKPLPMVVYIHGGPWLHTAWGAWGYQQFLQLLANRGCAVLAVNMRGSTSFGKRFMVAGDHEWGGRMQDDILDAVQWAVKAGIADPKRVAMFGWSYGGYATLEALARSPETFACGMDLYGPSDLVAQTRHFNAPRTSNWVRRVGDPDTPEGLALLQHSSPLNYVDRIGRPLLMAQGAADVIMPRKESDDMAAALAGLGRDVTYLLFPDEGHDFKKPENWEAFWAVAEGFLAKHIGTRAQPPGEDLSRSAFRQVYPRGGLDGRECRAMGEMG